MLRLIPNHQRSITILKPLWAVFWNPGCSLKCGILKSKKLKCHESAQDATKALLQLPDLEAQLGVCTIPSDLQNVVALYLQNMVQQDLEIRAMVARVKFPDADDLSGLKTYIGALSNN